MPDRPLGRSGARPAAPLPSSLPAACAPFSSTSLRGELGAIAGGRPAGLGPASIGIDASRRHVGCGRRSRGGTHCAWSDPFGLRGGGGGGGLDRSATGLSS